MAFDIDAGVRFVVEINRVRDSGANETVVRQTIVSGLSDIYRAEDRPWWVQGHIVGAEHGVRFDGGRGQVDSVVGLTAIEYEPDLRGGRFAGGQRQVRQYCAGLLNEGALPEKVRGVLSDGVDWYAYSVRVDEDLEIYSTDDVDLVEIEVLKLTHGTTALAGKLNKFLESHLGRPEVRPLTASSISAYMGLTSVFGSKYQQELISSLEAAKTTDPQIWALISMLWARLAGYLDAGREGVAFDEEAYLQELYLSMLAKLFCANLLVKKALSSDDEELDSILNGAFFDDCGLHRFVEHDYFGWIHKDHTDLVRATARSIQADLTAYDFEAPPTEDLFGRLMAELAEQSHRILLGQEWTPAWLAKVMAEYLFDSLSEGEAPHFIDMCCGSGSMLVEVTRRARIELTLNGVEAGTEEAIEYLEQAAVGFDIDPLAVLLAKVNWVATNRDWITSNEGSRPVSVPIYHADSLFTLDDMVAEGQTDGTASVRLKLADGHSVELPRFLTEKGLQSQFDSLVDGAYWIGMDHSTKVAGTEIDAVAIDSVVERADPLRALAESELEQSLVFVEQLAMAISELQRSGRNGIWAFIVRNTYRPALVAGQFNGLISNPPWLALSKIGRNPLQAALQRLASRYSLLPPGSAFPHLDLSTTFLAHSVDRYLKPGALVACVLPRTILNGQHHQPFRMQLDGSAILGVVLRVDEVWLVERHAFLNRAMVLLGRRLASSKRTTIPASELGASSSSSTSLEVRDLGGRHIWLVGGGGHSVADGYAVGLNQGADVMPRTLFFVEASGSGASRAVREISRTGASRYLLAGAKKVKEFRPKARSISKRFVHTCYLSHHVVPFSLAPASSIVAPIERVKGVWELSASAVQASDPKAARHFKDAVNANPDWSSIDDMFSALNLRNKLTMQTFGTGTFVVVYGAGGGIPAAAYVPASALRDAIFDQTLYWIEVDTEDEALYLVGMLNSCALRDTIEGVMPEGDFGPRHLHTIPARATPRFDAGNLDHARVVALTRALSAEFRSLAEGVLSSERLLKTDTEMKTRRAKARRVIEGLSDYIEYEEACSSVLH